MELTLKHKTTDAEHIEQALARMPIFAGLSEERLRLLSDAAMHTHFRAGQMIFRQGEAANRFFLIERGKVSLIDEQNGEPCRFAVLGGDEVLGWSWLFPPHFWNFTARAIIPTDAIFFHGTQLREACEADHGLGFELMKRFSAVMVQRLRSSRVELIEARRQVYRANAINAAPQS